MWPFDLGFELFPEGQVENVTIFCMETSVNGSVHPSGHDRRFGALLEIVRRLRKPFDLDDLLDEILDVCVDLLEVEASTLLLANPEETFLSFHSIRGGREQALSSYPPIPVGEGVAGWAALHRKVVHVPDVSLDKRFTGNIDEDMDFQTRSILAVPLEVDGRLLGVLEALNKKSGTIFGREDEDILLLLAEQASDAIEQVRQAQERFQEDRMAVIGRMASSIIHDIKNPMAAIQGYAHLIARQSPEHRRYADIIISEIDRLVGMTKELLDFSKGGTSLQLEEASWSDFVADVAQVLSRDLENQGIELRTEIEDSGLVCFDPSRMRRVLFNLAGNARDAMSDGGLLVLATDSSEGSVGLEVRDTGVGMDAKALERVFTPFYSSKGDGGTGLGTSIVKSVIEAHCGEVSVESTPGEGSVFRIEIPRKQP